MALKQTRKSSKKADVFAHFLASRYLTIMRFPATILLFILVPTVARAQKQPAANSNTTIVFCNNRSICLLPSSIDLALICDFYHHFEFPKQTMESIQHALSDG